MVGFILEIPVGGKIENLETLFVKRPEFAMKIETPALGFIAWGDPIAGDDFVNGINHNFNPQYIVSNLCGHYYFLLLDKKRDKVIAGNSVFSILPVYYHRQSDKVIVSDNALSIAKHAGLNQVCMRFILETLLFNYPLFNNSIIEDINLLPSNSCLCVEGNKMSLEKHTFIESLFCDNPLPWKKAADRVADHFIDMIQKYLPFTHYVTSLTGGFDGRAIVSAGLYHARNFSTYSFGNPAAADVRIAESLSLIANLSYLRINLDNDYINNHCLDAGREFIYNSSGTATFARAHYLHAAKMLAANDKHIISGNFGSELMRSYYITGVIVSGNLYRLFSQDRESAGKAIKSVAESEEFSFLEKGTIKEAWDSLTEDLVKLPCYKIEYSGLTRNGKFYLFVFEEIFRKYFGAEMINQFRYIRNRTPYIDLGFIRELLKTELAGVYSDFFESNPLKRYKGQVLYAHIMRKAFPSFGKIQTDKGYNPDDLLGYSGKIRLALNYMKKLSGFRQRENDPYSVERAWTANNKYWMTMRDSSDIFNWKLINNSTNVNREILFKAISLSYTLNAFKNGLSETEL